MFDLVIAGGTVLDPASGLNAKRDIGISGGRIVAIEEKLNIDSVNKVIDAAGAHVTPGFVDLHAHVYWGVSWFAIDADAFCTASGVTTVVDAGSAGPVNFPGFRRYIVEPSWTRILAFVHIAQYGIQPRPTGELVNIGYADPKSAALIARENADITVGIKIRLGATMVGDNGPAAFKMALGAARDLGGRLMVHIGDTPVTLDDILNAMSPGDIITHCYHGLPEGVLDEKRRLRPSIARARERGVLFDLGHASQYMLNFKVARDAMAQNFRPDTLSTDATTVRKPGVREPGRAMSLVLTKFLALGWSLEEVIAACTVKSAEAIGWQDRIGRLAVGREADITVFKLRDGPITLTDTDGNSLQGNQEIVPLWTIRAGQSRPARGNPAYVPPTKPHPGADEARMPGR